ncbi:hypothetical protein [Flagellimonas abyssi]|jgi:hypothetical protein|uniref:Chemotaxis methyl-accepting receptor HlyB-like 4HB MCP domain-containing protein n=1 Tax=Flagellimonas abyssi TaxID=2864871 RepID=A0ABS7ESR5_9FLAO|nr:hypothetical protein [Allomuricauda abyssi]MBW8200637.1 hypothetical protein [Allomuricauda abyssi]
MSAKLTLKQRILVGFVLALAFFLVLGSNLVDRRHFSTIQKTIESIHDDRVVVQDYIYQLRNFLHDTEVEVLETGNIAKSNERDKQIIAILDDFAATELTREEATFLKRLRQQFYGPAGLSSIYGEDNESKILGHIHSTKKTLDALEEIQIEESGHLTQISEKSLSVNKMLSNLEIAFMIVIGVSILMLVFQPIKTLYPIR